MAPVTSFTGTHRFLSNFYPALVGLDDLVYPTVEHAYQAAKTLDPLERAHVRSADTPGEAKRRGRQVTKRTDWDDMKVNVMHALLRQKFANNRKLRDLLVGTSDAELIEGNGWGDTFWGVCRGVGENKLGKLLMAVRSEVR